jgi:hypothetical protein
MKKNQTWFSLTNSTVHPHALILISVFFRGGGAGFLPSAEHAKAGCAWGTNQHFEMRNVLSIM